MAERKAVKAQWLAAVEKTAARIRRRERERQRAKGDALDLIKPGPRKKAKKKVKQQAVVTARKERLPIRERIKIAAGKAGKRRIVIHKEVDELKRDFGTASCDCGYTEDDLRRIGYNFAKVLGMKRAKHPPSRWHLTTGSKTDLGLARTIISMVQDIQGKMPPIELLKPRPESRKKFD